MSIMSIMSKQLRELAVVLVFSNESIGQAGYIARLGWEFGCGMTFPRMSVCVPP